jgi:hypothetical protein
MADPSFDPDAILNGLIAHGVDFVVIGGIAAAIHGAGWTTFDLDVVVATSDDNLARLTEALLELEAVYETFDSRRIKPDHARVRSLKGPQLLRTRHGRLDVLKEAGGETYESLVTDAVRTSAEAQQISLASVAALLRMKQAANRPKDQPGIARLRALLSKSRSDDE